MSWLLCLQGLITDERKNIDPDARLFARNAKEIHRQGLREGASLVEVVCEFSFTWYMVFLSSSAHIRDHMFNMVGLLYIYAIEV